jgi:hypothetical protein
LSGAPRIQERWGGGMALIRMLRSDEQKAKIR